MLFGVTLITFLLFNVVGGDPAFQLAGRNATAEQIASIREELGTNKPLFNQYLDFAKKAVTFNWGESWHTNENINNMIIRGLGPSLSLTLPAFLISFLLSISVALFSAAAHQKYILADKVIMTLCLALMSFSFLIYIISFQYFFAFKLGWFEVNGWEDSWDGRWVYLFLPWLIAITVSIGPNILIFRSAILDEIHQDYVRTAQAKGISTFRLFSFHVLKNAMIPIITIVVMQIPFLMTGSLLLEAFFGIPGIGGLLMQSLQNSDFPVVKALTVLGSILYMIFNLISDLLYAFFDPRVELR